MGNESVTRMGENRRVNDNEIMEGFQSLQEAIALGFARMDARFDRLEQRVERLEIRVGRLEHEVAVFRQDMQRFERRVDASLANHERRIAALEVHAGQQPSA